MNQIDILSPDSMDQIMMSLEIPLLKNGVMQHVKKNCCRLMSDPVIHPKLYQCHLMQKNQRDSRKNHQLRMARQKSENERLTKRPRYSSRTTTYSNYKNYGRNRFQQRNHSFDNDESMLPPSQREF